MPSPRALICWAALSTLACTGSVDGTRDGPAAPAGASPDGPAVVPTPVDSGPLERGLLTSCDPAQSAAPPQRVWMLTPEQFEASVAALYEGTTPGPQIAAVTQDNRTYDGNDANLLKLNTEQVRGLLGGADAVGEFIGDNIEQVAGCAAADVSCFNTFLSDFAQRAWRSPISDEQLARLRAVYDVGAEVSVQDGYRLAIAAVLKSPRFAFRTEIGQPGGDGTFALTPWEIASQLSYYLLDAPPDAELRQLAATGAIAQPEVFAQQVERLIADPRVRSIASRFLFQMTSARSIRGLTKAPAVVDVFDDQVTEALLEELRQFSQASVFDGGGDLATLLTGRDSFVNGTVAEIYGLSISGEAFQPTTLPETRSGFLTMPVLMSVLSQADHVVPTARGRFVLDKLLCSPIPPPPDIPDDAPAANPDLSPRQRLEVMQDYPVCAGCHNLADPVGFAFDHFDPIGRYVTEVKGVPVDPSGQITNSKMTNSTFADLGQLSQILAESPEVRGCINVQFFEFAQGRAATTADGCRVLASQEAFESSGGRIETLIRQVLADDSLHIRSVSR